MRHAQNFEQNFNELILGFIGETLRENISRENFDESLAIRQKFIKVFRLHYTV